MRFIRYRVTGSVGGQSAQLKEMTFYGENTEAIELERTNFQLVGMPSDNPGSFYNANPSEYLWDNYGMEMTSILIIQAQIASLIISQ